jgi:hypothetical protein
MGHRELIIANFCSLATCAFSPAWQKKKAGLLMESSSSWSSSACAARREIGQWQT